MEQINTIIDFLAYFKDEETCLQYITETRFKNGKYCPFCGHKKIYTFKNGKTYKCAKCLKKFSVKVGTIFENSKISLKKWLLAIFLLSTNKKGISSVQLASQLGVTQKTAWFMNHRIRNTYNRNKKMLSGTIEVDETYIGGKEKNKHKNKKTKGTQGRSTKTKAAVIGIVERKGEVKAFHVESVNTSTVKVIMDNNVTEDSTVIADEYKIYDGITCNRVNHSAGMYVIGDFHTNTVENFWSILKRGFIGIYHYWSKKHLQRYLNEFTHRYNNRDEENFDTVHKSIVNMNNRLTYRELVYG